MGNQLNHNPVVYYAAPILTVLAVLHKTESINNAGNFKQNIIELINNFQDNLQQINYPKKDVITARYCLCCAIDELVLRQPWSNQIDWCQYSLLSLLHKETWGGERFYLLAEQLVRYPQANLHLLELIYILLSIGYEGKLFDKQVLIRDEVRKRLYYQIKPYRYHQDTRYEITDGEAVPLTKKHRYRHLIMIGSLLLFSTVLIFTNINTYSQLKPWGDNVFMVE